MRPLPRSLLLRDPLDVVEEEPEPSARVDLAGRDVSLAREPADPRLEVCRRRLSSSGEILDLSRVEAGELKVDLTATDVAAVLREAAESIEPLVERSRVSLRLTPAPTCQRS
jgi:signal transduction histidine kinase